VLVYGDTNSTLAGGLAAAQAGVPVVHVEAGMRSFDRTMPEELNRVLTDHLADLLLCASQVAAANLSREAVAGRIELVGDVMVDVALRRLQDARADAAALRRHGVQAGEYLLCTVHRAGNVDDPARLRKLVGLLESLATRAGVRIVLSLHPRTHARLRDAGLLAKLRQTPGIELGEPLGYLEFSALLCHARAVVSDSGGVQKEAYLAGVPCITLRANTEWIETVEAGWNTLVDLDAGAALQALEREPPHDRPQLYGDGQAAQRCVEAISAFAEEIMGAR
jgi:UDP-N-acetylglucosamine 2-epimerase (non-hydrolysing)/UDP-GlcNAc3NAcA epimerase